jgi:hypothetical protein
LGMDVDVGMKGRVKEDVRMRRKDRDEDEIE